MTFDFKTVFEEFHFYSKIPLDEGRIESPPALHRLLIIPASRSRAWRSHEGQIGDGHRGKFRHRIRDGQGSCQDGCGSHPRLP